MDFPLPTAAARAPQTIRACRTRPATVSCQILPLRLPVLDPRAQELESRQLNRRRPQTRLPRAQTRRANGACLPTPGGRRTAVPVAAWTDLPDLPTHHRVVVTDCGRGLGQAVAAGLSANAGFRFLPVVAEPQVATQGRRSAAALCASAWRTPEAAQRRVNGAVRLGCKLRWGAAFHRAPTHRAAAHPTLKTSRRRSFGPAKAKEQLRCPRDTNRRHQPLNRSALPCHGDSSAHDGLDCKSAHGGNLQSAQRVPGAVCSYRAISVGTRSRTISSGSSRHSPWRNRSRASTDRGSSVCGMYFNK